MSMEATENGIWNVSELEEFFNLRELPPGPIRLNSCTVVDDVRKFIQVELSIVKAHNGEYRYRTYYERLRQLKAVLS